MRRKTTRAIRGLLAAGASVALCANDASAYAQQSAPRIDEPELARAIHAYLDPLAASNDVSGVIRIERGSKVTEAWFGYADWSRHTPITSETEFGAGSIAKSMIGTVIARLALEKRLDTGATVSRYVPVYRHGARMTVGQVLQHTAGLPRRVPDADRELVKRGGLVAWLDAHPPAPSGGKAVYSNVGYDLLALIAASAGGAPFDSLVQKIIFDPLHLAHSRFATTTRAPRAALPHVPDARGDDVRVAPEVELSASGALFATTSDLASWGRAVRDSEIVSLRESDGTLAGSVYAKTIAERQALWMQGTIPGGGAVVATFPGTDVVIVVALNLGTYPLFNSEMVASEIAFGLTPRPAPVRLPAAPLSDAHRAMAGEYIIPGIGRIRIHETDGEMRVALLDLDDDQALTPASEGRLVWRAFNFTFAARRDAAGVVNGLRVRLHMVDDTVGDSEADKLR